jgi:hypothetical protein
MCAEHFDYVPPRRTHSYPGACDAFAYEPVSTIEGGRTAVEGVTVHVTLLYRPS